MCFYLIEHLESNDLFGIYNVLDAEILVGDTQILSECNLRSIMYSVLTISAES